MIIRSGLAILACCAGACAHTLPPAPVRAAEPPAPAAVAATVPPDVQFVRDMIMHHAQAIEMARLAPSRSTHDQIRSLAERIDVSQISEIQLLTDWLHGRGATAPATAHNEDAGPALMPGMLSPQELQRLRAAGGSEFDRLFLAFMTKHHEGALTMVERLFATPGGVSDVALYQLANNIDADQRAEIARMRVLLSTLH